ncbi:hypothetical protein, partial [Rhodoferax sp.]|uniref:hypothetical protein n=1 Tax=Rhodoferax sp. TaxID=50421 RepID=UPI003BB721EE
GGIEQAAQQGAGVKDVGVGIGHGRFAEGQRAGLCDEPASGMTVPVNRSPQFTSMSSRMRSSKALLVASLMAGTPAQPKAEPRPVVKQMICALVGVGARQHGGDQGDALLDRRSGTIARICSAAMRQKARFYMPHSVEHRTSAAQYHAACRSGR